MNPEKELKEVRFWVSRAWVCVYLKDYESAIDRMNKALKAFDWLKIALIYSDKWGDIMKSTISLRKGSKIYIVTDHKEYKHVKGKSLDNILLDEARK